MTLLHPSTSRHVRTAVAVWLAHGLGLAQSPAPSTPTPADVPAAVAQRALLSPIAPGPTAPDGATTGLWAAGAGYKVQFTDGMTFYPHVGPTLPHQPVRWRTTSVTAGGVELLAAGTAPRAQHDATTCAFDLGAVVERYEVRLDGVEQSFLVRSRPNAGDLVVTGELTTPLVVPPTPAAHGPLTLRLADGRDVVHYGAAVAIDAHGRTTRVTTATDGNRVLLRVAAADVAAAAFPLLIDPLLSTSPLLGFGPSLLEVDVLHETLTPAAQQANLWYAWTAEVAAGDRDIRLWRTGSDWTGTITEQYRDISNWDARHGRLALAPGANRVVLVHSLDFGAGRFVVVHRHHVNDNFLLTNTVAVPQSGVSMTDWRPDVGGRLDSGSQVLITFQREAIAPFQNTATSTIHATVFDAAVNPASAGFVAAPFVVLARPNADQERPVVNQAAATANWLVAFQELDNQVANDDWDVTTVAVDAAGTVVPTGLAVAQASDPMLHKIDPELAGAHGRFTLTYTTRAFELPNPAPTTDIGSAVHAQRVFWDFGANTGSLPFPMVTLVSLAQNGLTNEGSAYDATSRSHWCAGVAVLPPARYRVFKLGYTGEVVEGPTIQLPAGSTAESLATTFSSSPRQFPIVYVDDNGTVANLLQGTFLQYAHTALPVLVGSSCGSGTWTGLQATADRQQIGSQAMPLRLAGAPDDSIALLALSTAELQVPGSAIGLDGCTLVPDLALPNYLGLLAVPIVNGNAMLTLDLPPALAPFTLVAQWGYLVDPPTNPLGIQLSEGLRITVDR